MSSTTVTDPRCRKPAVVEKKKDEVGTRGLEGFFYIDLPADRILEILWSPDNFEELYPAVKSIEVTGQTDDTVDVAFHIDAVLKDVRYSIRRTLDRKARSIEWRELAGDLKRVRGGWYIAPTDDPQVSKITYRAFVAVNFFVPTSLVAAGAIRKMNEMVDRVRRVAHDIVARSAVADEAGGEGSR